MLCRLTEGVRMPRLNPFALLPAVGGGGACAFYFATNPTPTIYAGMFFASITAAAVAAVTVPRRAVGLGLLTFVLGSSVSLGMITVSGFGFILFGEGLLALIAFVGTRVAYRDARIAAGAFAPFIGGIAGVVFVTVLLAVATAFR